MTVAFAVWGAVTAHQDRRALWEILHCFGSGCYCGRFDKGAGCGQVLSKDLYAGLLFSLILTRRRLSIASELETYYSSRGIFLCAEH